MVVSSSSFSRVHRPSEADAAAGGEGGLLGGGKRKNDESSAEQQQPLTKRQRQKQLQSNTKNLLPRPHPRMQSAEARARQHVRIAGFSVSKKNIGTQQQQEEFSTTSPEIRFGRLLGSTEPRTRHQAVVKLQQYLKARCAPPSETTTAVGLSELDLLKVWKGLWCTLYLADHVAVQEELATHIAKLIWCVAGTEEEDEYAAQVYLDICASRDEEAEEDEVSSSSSNDQEEEDDGEEDEDVIMEEMVNTLKETEETDNLDDENNDESGSDGSDDDDDDDEEEEEEEEEEEDDSLVPHCRGAHLASLFVATFFQTLHREWGRMDKYRIDKFYALVRMLMQQVLTYMAKRHWNMGIIRLFNDTIHETVLSKTPNGLRFHLIDIVLQELAKVNATVAPMKLTEATFLDVLEPYFALAQTGAGGDDQVQKRVVEMILVSFLDDYSIVSSSAVAAATVTTASNEKDVSEKSLIFDQVHVGTIAEFIFTVGSDGATPDKYRKSLYDVHKQYLKRLKQVGRDVDLHDEDDDDDDDDDDDEEEVGDDDDEAVALPETAEPGCCDNHVTAKASNAKVDKESKEDVVPAQCIKHAPKKSKSRKKGKDKTADHETVPSTEDEAAVKKQSSKKANRDGKVAAPAKATIKSEQPNDGEHKNRKPSEAGERNEGEVPALTTTSKKKKKKRKKKRKSSDASDEPTKRDVDDREQEITISFQDQKDAIAALSEETGEPAKKKKKKDKSSAKESESIADKVSEQRKRVKFNKTNRARSYDMSIQGLRTKDPTIALKTGPSPEKGILRNKETKIQKARPKGNRRRAVDYF